MSELYTDIDYESFPVADLAADIHWIQLPAARWAPIYQRLRDARERQRLARLPKNHKIILIPVDPDFTPAEHELWPIINRTVISTLRAYPEALESVSAAVRQVLADHRGWRNPYPHPLKDSKPN